MADTPLTHLEREILEACRLDSAGETTRTLYVEMLQSPPDRVTLEATLRGLAARGFMNRWRGTVMCQDIPDTCVGTSWTLFLPPSGW
jgi:hypothetical protein